MSGRKMEENSFEINILEELSYDKDDTKTDYSEDLKS